MEQNPMFERQHTAATAPTQRVSITLTMTDGQTMRGNLRLPLSGRIFDAMNNPDQYFDLETLEGERLFLAKHSVRKVEGFKLPKTDQLARPNDRGVFDPYAVLRLPKAASPQAVRESYLTLARTYHPDRFAGIDLPPEMRDYVNAMLTRINVAYQALQG
jgi:DnaJ-domain-containing protein 1